MNYLRYACAFGTLNRHEGAGATEERAAVDRVRGQKKVTSWVNRGRALMFVRAAEGREVVREARDGRVTEQRTREREEGEREEAKEGREA